MLQTRAPLTTANFNTAPNNVMDFPVRRVVERQPDPLGILDVANIIPVSTNSVEIVKYDFTSNAAVVDEGDGQARVRPARADRDPGEPADRRPLHSDEPSIDRGRAGHPGSHRQRDAPWRRAEDAG